LIDVYRGACRSVCRPEMSLHASLHHPVSREWSEPHLHASSLVYPIFVTVRNSDVPIKGMPASLSRCGLSRHVAGGAVSAIAGRVCAEHAVGNRRRWRCVCPSIGSISEVHEGQDDMRMQRRTPASLST
jgi:hypothetical protein